jgi:hypothetical protein
MPRQARVDVFVEQGFAPGDLQVGLAGQALDRGGKFVEGGGIDQVDGKAHGNADRDRGDGQEGAHRVGAPLAKQQPAREQA